MIVRKTQRTLPAVVFALAASLSGCLENLPGKPDRADRPVLPAEQTDFQVLLARHCSGCHGADGRLGPAPPLNDPLFLSIVPDDVLVDVITHGRAGTPMPAFGILESGNLTEEQISVLAQGLKSHWQTRMAPSAELPSYSATAGQSPSAENVARGEKLFAQACAGCHGANGAGSSENELPGRINDRSLLALISNQALRRIIITGRPDLGMPDFRDGSGRDADFKPLSNEQINDLVALLAHWRGQADGPAAKP